jgi:hypothetical protein
VVPGAKKIWGVGGTTVKVITGEGRNGCSFKTAHLGAPPTPTEGDLRDGHWVLSISEVRGGAPGDSVTQARWKNTDMEGTGPDRSLHLLKDTERVRVSPG